MAKAIRKGKESKAQLKKRVALAVAAIVPRLAQIEEDAFQTYGGPGFTREDVHRMMIAVTKVLARRGPIVRAGDLTEHIEAVRAELGQK